MGRWPADVSNTNSPGHNTEQAATRRRWAVIGLLAGIATVVTLTFTGETFDYSSVCHRCGTTRQTTAWYIPLTSLTAFNRSREADTPLSRVLATNAIVPPHGHQWLFNQGGGRGVRYALGPGDAIRRAVDSRNVAGLVQTLHVRQQFAFRDRILQGALDPDVSQWFLTLNSLPLDRTLSNEELQRWMVQQAQLLDEIPAVRKKQLASGKSSSGF